MALFNRKKRADEGGDNVRLTSADHAWWTGEEAPLDGEGFYDATAGGAAPGEAYTDDDGLGQRYDDVSDDATLPHADLDEPTELMDGIADALNAYGYGHGPDPHRDVADDIGDDGGVAPGEHFAGELQGEWQRAESDEDLAREVLEQALFCRDGLPTEDHLGELLGALGLEGDADWVDIARAHRRLVTTSGAGRAEWDQDRQRRIANEAYACLRLFHH